MTIVYLEVENSKVFNPLSLNIEPVIESVTIPKIGHELER